MTRRGFLVQVSHLLLSFVLVLGTLTIISCGGGGDSSSNITHEEPSELSGETVLLAEYQAWHGLESHCIAFCNPDPHYKDPYFSSEPYNLLSDPNVIPNQIQKAKDMGIHGFVVNWYGHKDGVANDKERDFMDQVTDKLIREAEGKDFSIALMYDEGTVSKAESDDTSKYMSRVQSDLNYAQKYFALPAYLHINDRPALFIFPYNDVDQFIYWRQVRNELNTQITLIDKDPNPKDSDHDNAFDGFYSWVQATNEDWKVDGTEWGKEYLNGFYLTMNSEAYANKITVGGVWPGFDDSLVTEGGVWPVFDPSLKKSWGKNRYISRQNGQVYDNILKLAKKHNVPYIMIATWNDFEEGTDIEFGVKMVVDMEDPDSNLLVRSSPFKVEWNSDRSNVVLEIYKDENLILKEKHSSGVFIDLKSNAEYELKIWSDGAPTIAKWVKIRGQDPIPNIFPVFVD